MKFYCNVLIVISSIFFLFPINKPIAAIKQLDPVKFQVNIDREQIRVNENFRIIVSAVIDSGWSIYTLIPNQKGLLPVNITLNDTPFKPLTDWYETKPSTKTIASIGLTLQVHSSQAYFYRNFMADADLVAADYPIKITIDYQVCSDIICLLPTKKELELMIPISSGLPRAQFQNIDKQLAQIKNDNNLLQASIGTLIGLAILGALFTLSSPCVLPMVPLTLSYFRRFSKKKSSILLFILSIVICYLIIGVLITSIFGVTSIMQLANSAYSQLFLSLLFIIISLSMIINFKLNFSVGLLQKFDNFASKFSQIPQSIIIGVSFTICSLTCNIQIIGSLLVLASSGNLFAPIIGMAAYSFTLAVILSILGFIPNLTNRIKGGYWQKIIRHFFSALLLLIGVKYFVDFNRNTQFIEFSRDDTLILICSILLLLMFYSFILLLTKYQQFKSIKNFSLNLIFFILAAGFFASGYNDYSLGSYIDVQLPAAKNYLHGRDYIDDTYPLLNWNSSLPETLQLAKQNNLTILVYFSGQFCVSCRVVEQQIFMNKKVHQFIYQKLNLVKLNTDWGVDKEFNQKLQIERFQTVAMPHFVLLSINNDVLNQHSGVFADVDQFLKFANLIP